MYEIAWPYDSLPPAVVVVPVVVVPVVVVVVPVVVLPVLVVPVVDVVEVDVVDRHPFRLDFTEQERGADCATAVAVRSPATTSRPAPRPRYPCTKS